MCPNSRQKANCTNCALYVLQYKILTPRLKPLIEALSTALSTAEQDLLVFQWRPFKLGCCHCSLVALSKLMKTVTKKDYHSVVHDCENQNV